MGARADWSSVTLETNAARGRIVGIMPPGFAYPDAADLWVVTTDDNPHRTAHNWSVIARLKAGREIGDARAELDQMFGGLKAQLGKDIDAEGATVRTLRESLTLNVRTLMYVLIGAVAFVLLVACTNLASANLARGESQQRELAVRTSLGAPRARLIRQLATEKIVLCVVGGLLGIALSWALVRIAVALGPGTLPAFATVHVDLRVMSFALVTAVLTGILTGIIPALSVTSNLRIGNTPPIPSATDCRRDRAGDDASHRRRTISAELRDDGRRRSRLPRAAHRARQRHASHGTILESSWIRRHAHRSAVLHERAHPSPRDARRRRRGDRECNSAERWRSRDRLRDRRRH
jgi:hypothetical protein